MVELKDAHHYIVKLGQDSYIVIWQVKPHSKKVKGMYFLDEFEQEVVDFVVSFRTTSLNKAVEFIQNLYREQA